MRVVRGAARRSPGGRRLRALVLAAGAGTRLRPLTDSLPKPLAPVGGRPVVARLLDRLSDLDLDAVALNLHHGAELIERVVGQGPVYLREPWLRGTAGALAGAAGLLAGDDFLVASGDGVHDIDMRELVAVHRRTRAAATITAKRIDRPETCAVVALDEDGFVTRFVEKPAAHELFSDLASIGVYCFAPEVLDLVPRDRPYDIAGELIPALLAAALPVAAWATDSWWSDIGTPADLLAANLRLAAETASQLGVLDSQIAPDAVITPPVMIGPHSVVGAGARVERGLVLPGATVPAGRSVRDAIHGTGDDVRRAWLA